MISMKYDEWNSSYVAKNIWYDTIVLQQTYSFNKDMMIMTFDEKMTPFNHLHVTESTNMDKIWDYQIDNQIDYSMQILSKNI